METENKQFDSVVIGAGPAGYTAAIRLSQLGRRVCLIEQHRIGGVCLNEGCIPSKALLHVTKIAAKAGEYAQIGIKFDSMNIDLAKIQEWKNNIVGKLRKGVEVLLKENRITVIRGTAKINNERVVAVRKINDSESVSEISEQLIKTENVLIATGGSPFTPDNIVIDREKIISSREILDITEIPSRLCVIGGGYIGLELATVFQRLGTKITVIELMDQILPGTDPDLARIVMLQMKKGGIEFFLNSSVHELNRENGNIRIRASKKGERFEFITEKVLVTAGRKVTVDCVTEEYREKIISQKGFINVDDRLCTKIPWIFAAGDVTGPPYLAHKASMEGEIAAEAMAGIISHIKAKWIPAAVFTEPEIASVGITETRARESNISYIKGRFPFAALGRAACENETQGIVKIIADPSSHKILGIGIAGSDASSVISEACLALQKELALEDICDTVHAHPTFPECLAEAARSALGRAIHVVNKSS
jgi:dihydrolipoamide dehydrogenase